MCMNPGRSVVDLKESKEKVPPPEDRHSIELGLFNLSRDQDHAFVSPVLQIRALLNGHTAFVVSGVSAGPAVEEPLVANLVVDKVVVCVTVVGDGRFLVKKVEGLTVCGG